MIQPHKQPSYCFFSEGEARVTIFASTGNARTFNYQPGDISYVPAAMGKEDVA